MTLADYLSLFPAASRQKPRYMALAEAVLRQAADLMPLAGDILSGFSFARAEGAQLDALAQSIGLNRADVSGGLEASDEDFRQYVLDKLNLWAWDGTNEGVQAVLDRILPGSRQRDNADGTVTALPSGTLPAAAGDLFPVPAGVRTNTEGV